MKDNRIPQAGATPSSLPSSQARDPRRREPAASFFWSLAASYERLQTTQANFCAQAEPPGKPYSYKAPGSHHPQGCDLWTMGPDGLDGTEDDIGNWNLQDQPKK